MKGGKKAVNWLIAYMKRGVTPLLGPKNLFWGASKADLIHHRVNHAVLFKLLMDRNLPCTVLRFLFSWYKDQELAVHWNYNLSDSGVLSPTVR